MYDRLKKCVGCKKAYTKKHPCKFVCDFQCRGFPFRETRTDVWAVPCGVSYHANCIQAGEPFRTRLPMEKGLICPSGPRLPHFVCELCQVRCIINRELLDQTQDLELLLMERMRLIDSLSWWKKSTMQTYGPYLTFLERFEQQYGACVLNPTHLMQPPYLAGIPLIWAQQLYSLRMYKGERIKFNTIRMLRSAASLYYTWDMQVTFNGQVRRENKRNTLCSYVVPNEESLATFATKGMSRRLGTDVKPSWALSFCHIAYIDKCLKEALKIASSPDYRHELICAGLANLIAYFGWLRSTELFSLQRDEITIIEPIEGPLHGLPPNVGAIQANLLAETKTNACQVADVVMAYESLSGLSLGFWFRELTALRPETTGPLFYTTTAGHWTSRYFREQYAWPLLEAMRTQDKEPTLQVFGDTKGTRICDKVYSIHSWRRAGRSRAGRAPRHNEPSPKGTRPATKNEVYEHGRWTQRRDNRSEAIDATYNQWGLVERLALTMLCM
jgi:hypothetical protein